MSNSLEADAYLGKPVTNHQQGMQFALELAQLAYQTEEVPIGAVLVKEQKIIGVGFNQCIQNQDPSAHAEMLAIRQGAKTLNNYRLLDSTLYVTLEPCAMCAGLLVHARIKQLVFAAFEPKAGAVGSTCNLLERAHNNHQIEVISGVLADASSALLSQFFKARRAQKKQSRRQD